MDQISPLLVLSPTKRWQVLQLNKPLEWRLVEFAEDYWYSSAKLYETGFDEFGLLTHYS